MAEETKTVDNSTNLENSAADGSATATDYKALYEAVKAEKEILNAKTNNLAKEAAELRKEKKAREDADKAKLPQEEQYRIEIEAQKKQNAELLDKINRSEVTNIFASKGVKEDVYSALVEKITEAVEEEKRFEHRSALAGAIVDALLAVEKNALTLAKNGQTVKGTVKLGGSENAVSDFKRYQDEQNKKYGKGRVEL